MLSGSRLLKLEEWTSRFDRFERSGMTVVGFCDAEGVSVPSFYHWKKKLRIGSKGNAKQHPFQQVELISNQFGNPATTIWLGNDVRIELGREEKIAALVVKQVVDAMVATVPANLPGE